MSKLIKLVMFVGLLACATGASASGYNAYHGYVNKVVVQETLIPLYDTYVVTPHNQFFKTVADPQITQIVKIERLIEPQNYLLQRLEYPVSDPIIYQQQVVPYVQRQTLHNYRNYCR